MSATRAARYAGRMKPSSGRRVIRLFPDYGRDWPLWENSTPARPTNYTTTPDDYHLSETLTAALADWNMFWQTHFSEHGWDDAENEARWRRDGEAVAARLRQEVADFADVSYEA